MKKLNSDVLVIETITKSADFVIMQGGKGRREESMIQLDAVTFSYIEGLIWDKHREYGNKAKNKIPSPEWSRIIEGFNIVLEKLDDTKTVSDVKDILQFDIFREKYAIDSVLKQKSELKLFISNIIKWIEQMRKLENYILVMSFN